MLCRKLIVLACTLIAFSGCTHIVDGALRKDVTNGGSRVQGDVVQEQSVAEIDEGLIDPSTDAIVRLYGPTIKRYARRYGVDWRLVLAIMKQESRFSPAAKSYRGASGLMQIMPVTSEELSRVFNVEDISHPNDNIRGGVYYLCKLYNLFPGAEEGDRIKLTLAAYNAGMGRIADAQELVGHFHVNPLEWESVRDALPLLSKDHTVLHRTVWSQDRPRTGSFRNWGETMKYVENVMNNYDDYRIMFN